jgi:excisionase family DNA binding protein
MRTGRRIAAAWEGALLVKGARVRRSSRTEGDAAMSDFRSPQARAESSDEPIHEHELTVEEVAELFRFPPDLIRHAIWNGELRARMLGQEICGIARTDLVAWLRARSEV